MVYQLNYHWNGVCILKFNAKRLSMLFLTSELVELRRVEMLRFSQITQFGNELDEREKNYYNSPGDLTYL
jgi:hypothetical protein